MISVRDVAWAAGIMEGEGYFGLRPNQIVATLCMTDSDTVDRMQDIFRIGHRKERGLPSGKTAYIWNVTNQTDVAALMMTLLPFMGQRRSVRIIECLNDWKSRKPNKRNWTHCIHGHELAGDNLILFQEGKYQKRRCRACGSERQRKHRAKLAA